MIGGLRRAVVLLAAASTALLLAGCGPQGPTIEQGTALPSMDWVPPTPTRPGDDPGRISSGAVDRAAAPDGTVWHMTLGPREAPVADAQWPDASTVLSTSELRAIFPDGAAVTTSDCDRGRWPDGTETTRNTECRIEVELPSAPIPSRIQLRIEGFGADYAMTERFDEQRAAARETAESFPDNYTFYQDGVYGAKKVYRDGSVFTVLISDGTVAGQFALTFSGFDNLVEDDHDASERALRTQVAPLIIQTLAAKMPRTR